MLMMYLALVETAEEQSLFQQIYYAYRKQMFFIASGILNDKILAEDAVQEAFLGIAKQIALFRNMPDHQVKAYVLTVAKNAAINLSKQEQKFQHHTVTDAQEIGFDPGLDAQSDQSLRCVIATLPAFQRDILMLRYTNDMNCSEIAIALGRKPSTVRKELSRARQALRKRCKKEGIDIED